MIYKFDNLYYICYNKFIIILINIKYMLTNGPFPPGLSIHQRFPESDYMDVLNIEHPWIGTMYYSFLDKLPLDDQASRVMLLKFQKRCIDMVIWDLYGEVTRHNHYKSIYRWTEIREIKLENYISKVEKFIKTIEAEYKTGDNEYIIELTWIDWIKKALIESITEAIKNHNSQLPLATKLMQSIKKRINF